MNLKLSSEAETFVQQQIAGGQYPDAASVIEAALRHMEAEQRWKNYAAAAIEEGVEQAERGKFVSAGEMEAMLDRFIRRPGKRT